ncbi:MAG: hypothetical protein WBA74_06565 [Cyclobacteriaceae bacterium]
MKYILVIALLFHATINIYGQGAEAGFLVKFKDEITPHRITGAFLVPGEKIKIETVFEDDNAEYNLEAEAGEIEYFNKNIWNWTAPSETGIYKVTIKEVNQNDSITLNCIVMVPFDKLRNGYIGKYRIGDYPKSSNELYNLPTGFIEVTKENEMTLVTPNYRLKDFLCKQVSDYPKYIVLKERGILKLQMIHNYLNGLGVDFKRFSFISGYRTPYYNHSIGNVKNSRHVFGDAYDIYIDDDGNGRMDDLNGDGKSDKKDVRFLFNKINGIYSQAWYKPFIGGLGLYGPNSRRTGFIHMDSRGYRARWGE